MHRATSDFINLAGLDLLDELQRVLGHELSHPQLIGQRLLPLPQFLLIALILSPDLIKGFRKFVKAVQLLFILFGNTTHRSYVPIFAYIVQFLQVLPIAGNEYDGFGDVLDFVVFQVEGEIQAQVARLVDEIPYIDFLLNTHHVLVVDLQQFHPIWPSTEAP